MDYRSIIESKYDRSNWQGLLYDIFRQKVQFWQQPQSVPVDENMAKCALYIGKITLPDGHIIAIYEVELSDSVIIERNRAGIRNLLCTNWRGMGCSGAFMFCFRQDEAVLRFSYVSESFVFTEGGSITKESTDTKRFTYLLGEGHRSRTAIKQFEDLKKSSLDLKAITKAFSVEALSDLFFREYKKQYEDIIEFITGKRMVKVANKWEEQMTGQPCREIMQEFEQFPDTEKAVRDYVKKLMGRLVFIQFLQKKGWMGCSAGESWSDGDKEFVQNLFDKTSHKNTFVDDVLEPLFNDINTKRIGDLASSPNVGVGIKIPYLNGGLFEKDDYDNTRFPLPAEYIKKLLDFFASYNFTIDENDPDDAEIGVDPEMLGKIFENLLEDNKDKGAFYTPKEIVRYMCQESLIVYLETNTSVAKDKIRQFVLSPEEGVAYIPENKKPKLLTALEEVKICDPAVGSGAFPMGLLNELLHCREVLSGDHYDRTEIKKSIIQNNIYGVDIEKGAVDIARLRFWLSIVVDEEAPSPLPNLDYKIMQGNSLIESFMGVDLSKLTYEKEYKKDKGEFSLFDDEKNRLQKTVSYLLSSYYSCSDHDKKVKLQQEISDTINKQLEARSYNPSILAKLKEINLAENNKFFLWHTWFSDVFRRDDKEGFDIVIGNPPYISSKTQLSNPILAEQRNLLVASGKYSCLYQKWDLYIPFIEFGINQICSTNGVCAMIVPYPLTNQIYAQKLREMILTKFHLFELVDLNGTKIFNNATVSNCIPFIKRTKGENTTISNIDEKLHITPSFTKSYKDLIQDEKTYIWNVSNENRDSNRHSDMLTLGDLCYISKGMVLYSEDGLFTNEDLISNTPDSIHCRPYLEAKDMDTYAINNIRYIEYDTHRVPDMVSRPTFRELYDRPKLMFNCLGKMKVMIDYSNQFVCQQGIRVALLWNDLHGVENRSILTSIKRYSRLSRCEMEKISTSFNMYYLLGILNSKYAAQLLTNIRGGDYHIVPEHIRNIPIASATVDVQNKVAEIVLKIIDLKRTQQNTSILETEIDKIVYSIYGLTDAEIKIIEQSI